MRQLNKATVGAGSCQRAASGG